MTTPSDPMSHVSAAPTLPGAGARPDGVGLSVAELYGEPAPAAPTARSALDEKLRQAYFWVANHAIISPHYDIEFDDPDAGASATYHLGDSRAEVNLPSGQSYSSYVLLPLLTFAVRGRCLLVGGPGRGKTASALLMGVLAGYPVRDVRRAMQHGHPQLTVADLFGTPLPRDLVSAERLSDVDVAWRSWLGMRVKIVDEYNRIPTRTQAALLTLLADGYVEVFDQVYETGDSAWYLTANDDAGGGTYQVVEALKDRIDVVVQALPFNNRFLGQLVARAEQRVRPEESVPAGVVFSEAEHTSLHEQVRAVQLPIPVRRRLEFFASQFELAERAGVQFEYRTKDTARLAGADRTCCWQRTPGATTAPTSGRRRWPACRCGRCSRWWPTPRPWPTSAAAAPSGWTTCGRCCPSCCTTSCRKIPMRLPWPARTGPHCAPTSSPGRAACSTPPVSSTTPSGSTPRTWWASCSPSSSTDWTGSPRSRSARGWRRWNGCWPAGRTNASCTATSTTTRSC